MEYDAKSVSGVIKVEQSGSKMTVTYDSDITSKDVIVANIHDTYSAEIVKEERLFYGGTIN